MCFCTELSHSARATFAAVLLLLQLLQRPHKGHVHFAAQSIEPSRRESPNGIIHSLLLLARTIARNDRFNELKKTGSSHYTCLFLLD
jgi:hypothetical protein